jgi:hypothetical protein
MMQYKFNGKLEQRGNPNYSGELDQENLILKAEGINVIKDNINTGETLINALTGK